MGIYLLSVFAGNALTGIINVYIQIPEITLSKGVTHMGYDGKKGTDDDLLVDSKGEIKSAVHDLLKNSSNAIQNIYLTKQSLPTTRKGTSALSSINDPWGNPLRYSLLSSSSARISSDGPDKTTKTKWDLGVIVSIREADADEKDTWLYREKKRKGMLDNSLSQNDKSPLKTTYYAGGQTKLEGAAYFWFFTKLMLITAITFIPFSLLYKPKTYLQE